MKGAPALWAARHAPARIAGVCYGRSDVEVTVAPEVAARDLRRSLPEEALGAPQTIWTSPAPRCRQVAHRLAAMAGAPWRSSEALYELDFGDWEGRSWESIARDDAAAYEAWAHDWERAAPPNGESLPYLEARVRHWATELDASCTHILIAHAGVFRALRVLLLGDRWSEAMRVPVPHLTWARLGPAGAPKRHPR